MLENDLGRGLLSDALAGSSEAAAFRAGTARDQLVTCPEPLREPSRLRFRPLLSAPAVLRLLDNAVLPKQTPGLWKPQAAHGASAMPRASALRFIIARVSPQVSTKKTLAPLVEVLLVACLYECRVVK